MSKLSRFKKAPAIKLPKKLPPINRKLDDDSDDDDDFVSRPFKWKEPSIPKEQPKPSSSVESSVSEYFPLSANNGRTRSNSRESKGASPESLEAGVSKNSRSRTCSRQKEVNSRKKTVESKKVSKLPSEGQAETTDKLSSPLKSPEILSKESDNDSESQGKAACPFCWKKLRDALSGTTHVKVCAKNVPIQQVMEAMQLQQKQIQEWEKLGLDFPGFSSNSGVPKTAKRGGGASRGRGGGRTRKKKETYDPEYELALALSTSLHEEIETRQKKENQFLIEHGLEKEIGLVEVKPAAVKCEELKKATKELPAPVASGSGVRRRGKKIALNQLPLYTVDEEQKRSIISDRVANIIDQSEKDQILDFYVSDKIPTDILHVPKRLAPFHNQESSLWSRANQCAEIPDESFSVLEPSSFSTGQLEIVCNPNIQTEGFELKSPEACGDKPENDVDKKNEKLVLDKSLIQSTCTSFDGVNGNLSKIEVTASKGKKCSAALLDSGQSTLVSSTMEILRNLPSPAKEITEMLLARRGCDMAIFGREEKIIQCHKFMISARCPKLLEEFAQEKCGQNERQLMCLVNFSHKTLKAFLWYVYTGLMDSTLPEELLLEFQELVKTCEMPLDNSAEISSKVNLKATSTCDVAVQTTVVSTHHASTSTENLAFVDSTETGFESTEETRESQELFTTFYERSEANPVTVSLGDIDSDSDVKVNEAGESPSPPSPNSIVSGGVSSDVDLFEDVESEMEMNKSPKVSSPVLDPIANLILTKEGTCTTAKPSSEEMSLEDDYLEDLASPVTQWRRSEKKRSRSPLLDVSGDLYTATQIANILQKRQEWRDLDEFNSNKATKKQKLDTTSNAKSNSRSSDLSMSDAKNDGDVSVNNGDLDKWDDDIFFLNVDDAITRNHSILATPKNNVFKSRRSVSTPNLSINSPSYFANNSHVSDQQISDNEYDAFADADDDSVFANIPEEVLAKRKTPDVSTTINKIRKNIGVSKCTSQKSLTPLSHTKRLISPRELSVCDPEDSFSTTKNKTGRGRSKTTKAKAAPKIKFTSGLQAKKKGGASQRKLVNSNVNDETSQQEDTVLSQQLPPRQTASPQVPACGNSSKSPLLNYSLIDTPVLKQELKKFGIKPLPRSKAKVLLRHIYKETHK